MGELILLDERRERRRAATEPPLGTSSQPTFYFDLACPLSYLTAERVERTFGDAHWVPVSAHSLRGAATAPWRDRAAASATDELRRRAEHRARQLRLPLVWPERFPEPTPCALRAAAHASEVGAGARFALAASRLAFCGGFDLEDPETLAEAAAAAGVPLEDCLAAAGDPERDGPLQATARALRSRGVTEVPAVGVDQRVFEGEAAVLAAAAVLHYGPGARPLAPAG